jgi:competence protein ComFB
MRLTERYDLSRIRNRTQEAVLERVESLIETNKSICTCEDCVLDLVAFILNRTTPMYGTSLVDPFHPNMEKERKLYVEIDLALEEGIRCIEAHPHHEENVQTS